ncbi:uncharacterized protein LOC127280342 [Leptopilina boulardi]|uniref:uncharacterized protein LOC127280342 n=1 Tax=Leptopilina boulardi TaxID=63433 RepID=UPI0021F663E9|nr:uncharacterized protein LOC127280342 [Leptopilina boulardi]XP_051159225.1 uncharacterized protein LOC127280342 [Leptopilina boulardi]
MDTFKNPLETVQLIPIFSYLNILSDFLFIENCLSEIDQNKPIPIVNALYEYIHDYENNALKKVQLIRELLKGSDLYGAKDDEYVDVTFVNVMFDHIISSLVFDKYGNIYGFVANIFHKLDNLQIETVLDEIILSLDNASYENEYGNRSKLSPLSLARIYNDIILPLFPIPNSNLDLLSIDYIYAQAGSMFLRAGRINTNNYIKYENNVANPTEDNLFDQYLITGQVIEKLILTDEKNVEMLKAFALPALTYYAFNSKFLFDYENMANFISESYFWQTAYEHLFQYTTEAFNDINVELQSDYTFKMHMALSSFRTGNALVESFAEKINNCNLALYSSNSESLYYQYRKGQANISEYAKSKINNISELYKTHELQIVEKAFSKSLMDQLDLMTVVIRLLIPNNTVFYNDFDESKHLPYDILEFFFPKNISFEYYILKREDYNATLIKYTDNEDIFAEDIRLHFEKVFSVATPIILKTVDENITVFFQNLINYKKLRFESQLGILDNCQEESKKIKSYWWKEFGLSLVPYYPCLGTNYGNICVLSKEHFFYKYQNNISSKAINNKSRSFLSSLGTTIKSVFLKNAISETVDEILIEEQKSGLTIKNLVNKIELFKDICLHIKDPAFQLTFTTEDRILLFEIIIISLREKTNFKINSTINSLYKIKILKSNSFKAIGTVGEDNTRLIFINNLYNQSDTGYGYKFIFLFDDISKIAHFRTGYELKDERLFTEGDTENAIKKYIALNNVSFKPEPDHSMYEINNQLRKSPTKVIFSGIKIQADDNNEKCKDIQNLKIWKSFNICRRQQRFNEKTIYERKAIKFVMNKTNILEEQITSVFDKFTFPDNLTLMQFVDYWIYNNSFEVPAWSRIFEIENSDLLIKLRYHSRFEQHAISNFDGEFRINGLYTKAERHLIEEEAPIKNIIKEYNEQNASYSVAFHDYYAIRNFATTGYTRITRDTQEAKLMKIALYKLAIRQSDDPENQFDLKLFRVESKPIKIDRKLSPYNNITLTKFTQAFPSAAFAKSFAAYPAPGCINIMYEMVFSRPYVRAKVEQFYNQKDNNVILLPGSEFLIVHRTFVSIGGLGKVLKLKLMFRHTYDEKYVWYKNIMNEIAHINL